MGRLALPAAPDLQDFLVAAGMIDDPPDGIQEYIDLQAKCDAAIDELERATGFKPFLNGSMSAGNYSSSGSPVVISVTDARSFFVSGADALGTPTCQAVIDLGTAQEAQTVLAVDREANTVTVAGLTHGHDGRVTPFPVLARICKVYDPPGPRTQAGWLKTRRGGSNELWLEGGLTGVPFSVTTGVGKDAPGTVLSPFVDYNLSPANAPSLEQPYRKLIFFEFSWE